MATDSERQSRSRKARIEAGGRQVAVMLRRPASEKLAQHEAAGEGPTETINRLLEQSKPKRHA